jgi:hypothetical protein
MTSFCFVNERDNHSSPMFLDFRGVLFVSGARIGAIGFAGLIGQDQVIFIENGVQNFSVFFSRPAFSCGP